MPVMQYIKLLKTKKIPVPDEIKIERDLNSTGDLILSRPLHDGLFSVNISNFLEEDEARLLIDKIANMKDPISTS